MSTWSTRVRERMKALGMTQEVLAEKMDITRGAITHYLAGRRQPPLKQFQKLAAILKVDPSWLQFGTSTAETPGKANKKAIENINHPLPILSWKQAAEFVNTNSEEINEFLPHFYTDQSRWYGLRVMGDSMTASQGKSFHEGDIIIVDPDKTPEHGNFVVGLLPNSNEPTFKQYVVDGGVSYLKPLNPQYPIVQIDKSTHIYGVIISSLNLSF